MKPGSKITGYWVGWPFHGEEFFRRFEKLEDAKVYFPVKKSNKGRKLPLGHRVITRVAWDHDKNQWSYDLIEILSQEEVDDAFMASVAEAAA